MAAPEKAKRAQPQKHLRCAGTVCSPLAYSGSRANWQLSLRFYGAPPAYPLASRQISRRRGRGSSAGLAAMSCFGCQIHLWTAKVSRCLRAERKNARSQNKNSRSYSPVPSGTPPLCSRRRSFFRGSSVRAAARLSMPGCRFGLGAKRRAKTAIIALFFIMTANSIIAEEAALVQLMTARRASRPSTSL